MKMPSTYISLLLLCGLMLIYRYTQRSIHPDSKPTLAQPFVKAERPVVKRILSDSLTAVPLNKNQSDENMPGQTSISAKSFWFFSDVVCRFAPALKNIK